MIPPRHCCRSQCRTECESQKMKKGQQSLALDHSFKLTKTNSAASNHWGVDSQHVTTTWLPRYDHAIVRTKMHPLAMASPSTATSSPGPGWASDWLRSDLPMWHLKLAWIRSPQLAMEGAHDLEALPEAYLWTWRAPPVIGDCYWIARLGELQWWLDIRYAAYLAISHFKAVLNDTISIRVARKITLMMSSARELVQWQLVAVTARLQVTVP